MKFLKKIIMFKNKYLKKYWAWRLKKGVVVCVTNKEDVLAIFRLKKEKLDTNSLIAMLYVNSRIYPEKVYLWINHNHIKLVGYRAPFKLYSFNYITFEEWKLLTDMGIQ